jgi:two-component system phosphate regulon sensor histidine kinase PhoR
VLRSSFFWKLYAGFIVLIVLTTGILTLTVTPSIEQESLVQIEESLWSKAMFLRSLAAERPLSFPDPGLQERVRDLGRQLGTRLTVIHADGQVVADSAEDPGVMDNHRTRPEVVAAESQGRGLATRYSETVHREMMYLALPISTGGETVGFVRAALPLTAVDARIREFRRTVLLGAFLAAVCGMVLGFFFTRHTTKPLLQMKVQAEAISRDHFAPPVPADRHDEIGALANSFNTMAEQLRDRMTRMQRDRRQLLAILSGMKEGVIAIDQEERIVHMNEVAGRLLRVHPEESQGRPLWEVTRIAAVNEILARVLEEGTEVTSEIRRTEPSREQNFQISASPLQEGQAAPSGAVAVLHDVTQLRHLERVRRDFVANVSHELKTPVTAIRGMVETLQEDDTTGSDLRHRYLEKIRRQANRLSSIVADLLTLSRFESTDLTLGRERLDLRRLLTDVHNSHLGEAENKNIEFKLDGPDRPVRVLGDEQALRQAMDNLLDNAIKYTPEGGRVLVRLRTTPTDACMEVEDTGIGISPGDRDRIFERFYRVDKARSRDLGGTGLGLSIVKHIATVHGGDVSVESTPGKGSTFRIRLPLEDGNRPEKQSTPAG